jgi:hypothetical protein
VDALSRASSKAKIGLMKSAMAAMGLVAVVCALGAADPGDNARSGRYQLYANPHANRIYVLDSQSGRIFQLITYKDINREILEEIPYIYGSDKLCGPAEYEANSGRCSGKNYQYIKSLIDLNRHQKEVAPQPPAVPQ